MENHVHGSPGLGPNAPQPSYALRKLRDFFWPIHRHETAHFLSIVLIMFCILFNYTALRNMKDSLLITAANSGAEVVAFVKVYFVIPTAFVIAALLGKLANAVTPKRFVYIIIIPFLVFFGLFAFVIYPLRDALHPSLNTIIALQDAYPRLRFVFPIFGNWSFVIFYIACEMWGSACFTYLFWRIASQATHKSQVERFYPIFGVLGNVALICAGRVGAVVSHSASQQTGLSGVEQWGLALKILLSIIVVLGVVSMVAHHFMYKKVLPPDLREAGALRPTLLEGQQKPSFLESFQVLKASKRLIFVLFMVMGYGLVINLLESMFKGQVKALYPNPSDYNGIMAKYFEGVGWISIVLMPVSAWVLKKYGWLRMSVVTPLVCAVTTLIFFSLLLGQEHLEVLALPMGLTPLALVVGSGFLANCFSKGTMYAFYEPSKELVYVPMSQDQRVKGKAAVDLIGTRLGKASGSLVQQFLLIATAGTQLTIAPYVTGVFIVAALGWLVSIYALDRMKTSH